MDDSRRDEGFADRIGGTRHTFGFSLHGRNGRVVVEYGPNDDPSRWGFGLLGLPWPTEFAIGLPALEATVSYAGEGYAAAMGWIQVVRIHVAEQSESLVSGGEKAPAGDHAWVDGPPSLRGLGVPFVSFGPRPALFDAPASTESDVRFVADSFLTASPDALVSRRSGRASVFGGDTLLGQVAHPSCWPLPRSALAIGGIRCRSWHSTSLIGASTRAGSTRRSNPHTLGWARVQECSSRKLRPNACSSRLRRGTRSARTPCRFRLSSWQPWSPDASNGPDRSTALTPLIPLACASVPQ